MSLVDDEPTKVYTSDISSHGGEGKDSNVSVFDVSIPAVLDQTPEEAAAAECNSEDCLPKWGAQSTANEWVKIEGWYNQLNFYSKVFQFFGETLKEQESMYGWWIILLSSLTSFIILIDFDNFGMSVNETELYTWG